MRSLPVTKKSEIENLVKVKTELADKHERLAMTSHSTPKRNTMLHHAKRFRRQAETLALKNQ